MLIVIEGPDKTGKTTLAKAVAERLGFKYVHFSAPKGNPADEYIDFLLNLKEPTVCDRFHLGEFVYGPIFRGKAGITDLELVTIERLMRLKQTIIVHAITNMALANERLDHSTQHEAVNKPQNLLAAEGFAKVVPLTNAGPVLKYNGVSMTNLKAALDMLKMMSASWVPTDAYTGIGTIHGSKLVFVGESVNKNVTWRGLPFDHGSASQFLLDTFKAAGVPEKAVYICNADTFTFEEALNLNAASARFIALGKKAHDKLTTLCVPHATLPHPQFVKRFQYHKKGEYVNAFKDIFQCA